MPMKAKKTLEKWDRGAKLTSGQLEELSQEFEQLLDSELDDVEQLANAGRGDEALHRMVRLSAFVSAASLQRPSLMS